MSQDVVFPISMLSDQGGGLIMKRFVSHLKNNYRYSRGRLAGILISCSLTKRRVQKKSGKIVPFWQQSEYCSTTQNCLFKILSLSAKYCWSKSNQKAKYDFSPALEEKLREESRGKTDFFLSKFWLSRKSHSIEKRKGNFLQNLEFQEENNNLFFKILTIEDLESWNPEKLAVFKFSWFRILNPQNLKSCW